MPFGRSNIRTLVSAVLLLGVLATSCGVEPGYETLDVRYDGVPINLDAASEASLGESAQKGAVSAANPVGSDAAESPDSRVSRAATNAAPDVLGSVTDPEGPVQSPPAARSANHEAHRDPEPEPSAEVVTNDVAELQAVDAVDSDARRASKARLRALRSFGGLVANATNLNAQDVSCLVSEVDQSGVNPVPMNRVLRRALAGGEAKPPPRYVALAKSAASACGVTLSESLLR